MRELGHREVKYLAQDYSIVNGGNDTEIQDDC